MDKNEYLVDILAPYKPTSDRGAADALQFYDDNADYIASCEASDKNSDFDWGRCRTYCKSGKGYSKIRFMEFVADWFGTTIDEMKRQWPNIQQKPQQ